MKKATELEPRNLSAAVRTRLDEIEGWLDKGVSRQEIAQLLDAEYSFSVTPKALEMALYRARLKRKKGGLHNPESTVKNGLHNPKPQEEAKPEDTGLHNPESEKLVEDMGGNKEFLSDTDFKKIGDEAKKVASSFKGSVGNKKGF
ncbi:hypothetical protein QQB23_004621 [Salmonella enterica]|jgi:DNA-binding transcriptional MerR regulator|uniref:StbA n=4 Tax=Enterobacterales TaxID=91347 RepID=A0A290GFI1_CITFR|nr:MULTISPECIES: hypothetical protein [Enterobacterales]EBH9487168.1 hypothetical protein [Salmonella enterica subsp. enterica serovar Cerro]EBV2682024.1 hypothetical protein [Salmonella enterica subsp. enterica serovar Newport]EBW1861819.1 hypothetical protein [Salmonella enterica subsp. enterica serovar Infantis]EBW6467492.1 hypothetical protein [Salmonella enterica subsp. enterica serovar Mikawasima]EBY1175336.1 hypothetical protein [Salmonella enterica subsp. enterica serovar Kentucky]EBY